jgi:ABC-type bacteriocin/lantibiotic exporter with double-glycine peptidase domain
MEFLSVVMLYTNLKLLALHFSFLFSIVILGSRNKFICNCTSKPSLVSEANNNSAFTERSEGITTLSEYYYNYIHKLAKQQHSKGATIVRSIIE